MWTTHSLPPPHLGHKEKVHLLNERDTDSAFWDLKPVQRRHVKRPSQGSANQRGNSGLVLPPAALRVGWNGFHRLPL